MSGGTKGEQSGFAVMRWSWTGFVPLLLAGAPKKKRRWFKRG